MPYSKVETTYRRSQWKSWCLKAFSPKLRLRAFTHSLGCPLRGMKERDLATSPNKSIPSFMNTFNVLHYNDYNINGFVEFHEWWFHFLSSTLLYFFLCKTARPFDDWIADWSDDPAVGWLLPGSVLLCQLGFLLSRWSSRHGWHGVWCCIKMCGAAAC